MRRIWVGSGCLRYWEIAEELELPSQIFSDYINEHREGHSLEEANLAGVVRRAYKKGWLDDWDVLELGLSHFVDLPLTPSQTEGLFESRHGAYALFNAGMQHMRNGGLPGPKKPGRPRLWSRVGEAEARAAYQAWLDEISDHGARVMDVDEWLGWLEVADPRRTMDQTMWQWGDGLDEVPCPPWLSDRDYWEAIYPLNHPLLLDRLLLITESDMPYTPHPERLELRPAERSLIGADTCLALERTEVVQTENGDVFEMEVAGDDLGTYFSQRQAALRRAEGAADDLFNRLRGRKSGGVDTRG
ncbi:hypothetical protein LPV64_07190, partial [Ralstonia pseudosolanacearum]|nr:hypothetical protein [Ralstonia pseudosolanacearum]